MCFFITGRYMHFNPFLHFIVQQAILYSCMYAYVSKWESAKPVLRWSDIFGISDTYYHSWYWCLLLQIWRWQIWGYLLINYDLCYFRLQLPLTATHPHPQTYTTTVPISLPNVPVSISQAGSEYISASPTQLHTATDSAFAGQTGTSYTHQLAEQASHGEPLFTRVPLPNASEQGLSLFFYI